MSAVSAGTLRMHDSRVPDCHCWTGTMPHPWAARDSSTGWALQGTTVQGMGDPQGNAAMHMPVPPPHNNSSYGLQDLCSRWKYEAPLMSPLA